jgi:hypothetical protein
MTASNAAPEWQAGTPRRRSGESLVACPLEGLVRREGVASPKAIFAGLHWFKRRIALSGGLQLSRPHSADLHQP